MSSVVVGRRYVDPCTEGIGRCSLGVELKVPTHSEIIGGLGIGKIGVGSSSACVAQSETTAELVVPLVLHRWIDLKCSIGVYGSEHLEAEVLTGSPIVAAITQEESILRIITILRHYDTRPPALLDRKNTKGDIERCWHICYPEIGRTCDHDLIGYELDLFCLEVEVGMIEIAGSILGLIPIPRGRVGTLDSLAMEISIAFTGTNLVDLASLVLEVVAHFAGTVFLAVVLEDGLAGYFSRGVFSPLSHHLHRGPVKLYSVRIELYLLVVGLGAIVEIHLLSIDIIDYRVAGLVGDLVLDLAVALDLHRVDVIDRISTDYQCINVTRQRINPDDDRIFVGFFRCIYGRRNTSRTNSTKPLCVQCSHRYET